MKYADLSCIKCGKASASSGWDSLPPYGTLLFTARGNYGSTVYDPMADECLLVIICDHCVLAEQKKQNVMRVVPARKTADDVREPWEPDPDPGQWEEMERDARGGDGDHPER